MNSYRSIFKGTAIIGGSSFVRLLISIVQTKFVAIFLGTFGVGLSHSYNNISGMIAGFCNFGIGSSAVRYISEAAGENGSQEKTDAITAVTFFLICCVAVITFAAFALAAYPLALLTFKDASYTPAIIFLGFIAVVSTFAGIPGILLQSHRKLSAIATSSIVCGILIPVCSIVIYYFFRVQGILFASMLSAVVTLLAGWYYIRKFKYLIRRPTKDEIKVYAWPIIKLGSGFFLPGLYNSGLTYVNNLILLRFLGIDYSGLYYSAMNLSGVLANFILNAMGTDYYPRLVQAVHDQQKMQKTVDEQLDIGMHLALPGLFFMIVFAPLVISIFYTKSFSPAIFPLQLLTIGVFARVVSWPVGYVFLAKADMKLVFTIELISSFFMTLFLYFGTKFYGLNGAAASYVWGGLFSIVINVFFASQKHGYKFCRRNVLITVMWLLAFAGMLWSMNRTSLIPIRWGAGGAILLLICFYCLRHLMKKMDLSCRDCLGFLMHRRAKC